jgi:hypothetical protein
MAASKKKAQSGAAISKKFTIPRKTTTDSSKVSNPIRKTTRTYIGVNQAEGDSMLNSFKKRNPGFKSGGTVKKKKK